MPVARVPIPSFKKAKDSPPSADSGKKAVNKSAMAIIILRI
jgi:hypothetical protein